MIWDTPTSRWTDALVDLFWTVDEAVKQSDDIPASIVAAWEKAEMHRRQMTMPDAPEEK